LLVDSEYGELWKMVSSKAAKGKINQYLLKCLVKRPLGFLQIFLKILQRSHDYSMEETVKRKVAGERDEKALAVGILSAIKK